MVNIWNETCYTELFSFHGRGERAYEKKISNTYCSDEELLKPVEWEYHCRIYTRGSVKRVVQAKATVPTATGYWWRCATPGFTSRERGYSYNAYPRIVSHQAEWKYQETRSCLSLIACTIERWTVLYVVYLI